MQRKPPSALLTRVRGTIKRYDMLAPGERVLVAVSGGPDSVALLGAMAALSRELKVRLCAAHLNHGLRAEEALRDQECATAVAKGLGLECVVGAAQDLHHGPNLEARAREHRYAFLTRAAEEQGCTKIATGHTLDDQAETVLMRLLRGTGADGLTAIQPVRDGRIIRPLIECTRAELLAFLYASKLPFCEDSSNGDRRFLRNRVRHDVIPFLESIHPAVKRRLATAAQIISDELGNLREREAQLLGRLGADGNLPVTALLATPAPLRLRLVRAWLRQQRGHLRNLSTPHFRAIAALAQGERPNAALMLPNGQQVLRAYDRLLFSSEEAAAATSEPAPLPVPGSICLQSGWRIAATVESVTDGVWVRPPDLFEAVADAAVLGRTLVVRSVRPGDRIRALGLGGRRKLQDLLVDRKVPLRTRRTCPVIELAGEVFWVPGVARSSHALVTESTRLAIRLTAEKPGIAGQ